MDHAAAAPSRPTRAQVVGDGSFMVPNTFSVRARTRRPGPAKQRQAGHREPIRDRLRPLTRLDSRQQDHLGHRRACAQAELTGCLTGCVALLAPVAPSMTERCTETAAESWGVTERACGDLRPEAGAQCGERLKIRGFPDCERHILVC